MRCNCPPRNEIRTNTERRICPTYQTEFSEIRHTCRTKHLEPQTRFYYFMSRTQE